MRHRRQHRPYNNNGRNQYMNNGPGQGGMHHGQGQGNMPPQGNPNMQHPGQMGQPGMQGQMPGQPNMMQRNQPMPPGQMQAPAPGMAMMGQPGVQQMNPGNMTIAQKYQATTLKYIPALNPNNPHLKQQVGGCIYEYVQQLVGDDKAPKITGMLIELPVNQIKEYMMDFNNLKHKVQEALDHWENAQRQEGN